MTLGGKSAVIFFDSLPRWVLTAPFYKWGCGIGPIIAANITAKYQLALRLLGLAITDQFCGDASDRHGEAEKLFQRLDAHYERLYYTGLLHERRAKAQMRVGRHPRTLAPLFAEAMRCFAEAETIRPPDNDDAVLRWNRCARLLQSHPGFLEENESEAFEAFDSSPI